MVPTISKDLRCRVLEEAEHSGFSEERLIEMFGRAAAEMVLQLLGGSHRYRRARVE